MAWCSWTLLSITISIIPPFLSRKLICAFVWVCTSSMSNWYYFGVCLITACQDPVSLLYSKSVGTYAAEVYRICWALGIPTRGLLFSSNNLFYFSFIPLYSKVVATFYFLLMITFSISLLYLSPQFCIGCHNNSILFFRRYSLFCF